MDTVKKKSAAHCPILIEADGIEVPDKGIARGALSDYEEKNVDNIDAYPAFYARQKGPATIYTLDRKHFSRLEGDIVSLQKVCGSPPV